MSELKAKSLVDLKKLAKDMDIPKHSQLKKLDLVYKILDFQAANPKIAPETKEKPRNQPKPRTPRPRKKVAVTKSNENTQHQERKPRKNLRPKAKQVQTSKEEKGTKPHPRKTSSSNVKDSDKDRNPFSSKPISANNSPTLPCVTKSSGIPKTRTPAL